MKCNKIVYHNFRNIAEEEVHFCDGVNVLHGDNAQGKTNMLEGIYLFARGKSFRAHSDKELIAFGEDAASVSLDCTHRGGTVRLSAQISRMDRRRMFRDGVRVEKTAEIIGCFRAVLFCPAHLSIIRDGPAVRRNFLDIAIAQLKPIYIAHLSRFHRILTQRNALLRQMAQGSEGGDAISVFSEQLAEESAAISAARAEYLEKLNHHVGMFFAEMTGEREQPSLTYGIGCGGEFDKFDRDAVKEKYRALLSDHLDREIRYGATLYGAHKDDIVIGLNGHEARLFASQGQQRSLALAMKLGEGEISREACGEYPVFLLDDVLSELDAERRAYILHQLTGRQVIVTSCEPIAFGDGQAANIIRIRDGHIETEAT